MLIPIGHEDQQVVRLPLVTIFLVVANIAVFLFTNSIATKQSQAIRLQGQEVVAFASEHPYLHLPPDIARGVQPVPPPPGVSFDTIMDEQAELDRLVGDLRGLLASSVFRTYGFIPAQPHPLTLFTSMFMHGGWLHLIGNMLFLWLAGASLEDRWGRLLYLLIYLASGAVGTMTHAVMLGQSTVPLIGASGAIAGLMGAFLVRLATTRIKFFYWFLVVRGTFWAPAFIVLPLWFLQQFAMAWKGGEGPVAVWAHIGGFGVGIVAALLIRASNLETNVLAPAIQKKTTWTASDGLTGALRRLDKGDADGAVAELQALLRAQPDSIEGRAALLAAYTKKNDNAAAGRESARLVGAYVRARDMIGAVAAAQEHERAYPDVPLALRDLLALAAHREKQGESAEAAGLYRQAVAAWPDDALAPKALVGYGRLLAQSLHAPDQALALLEQARTHPKVTPEFTKASQELIAAIRKASPEAAPASQQDTADIHDHSFIDPSLLDAEQISAERAIDTPAARTEISASDDVTFVVSDSAEPATESAPEDGPVYELPSEEPGPNVAAPAGAAPEVSEHAEPVFEVPSEEEPAPAPPDDRYVLEEEPAAPAPPPPPPLTLSPVSLRAVGMDGRGIQVQDGQEKTALLLWGSITGVAAARIGGAVSDNPSPGDLVLDLLLTLIDTPDGRIVRSIRLTGRDLALPQLKGEPSEVRGFQRVVATVLKASGATPHPGRDACLGISGFPAFPDLAAYEADLVARLAGLEGRPLSGRD